MRRKNCYALYKGDKLIGIGTVDELAELTGIMKKSVLYYLTPAYQRKFIGHKEKIGRIKFIYTSLFF